MSLTMMVQSAEPLYSLFLWKQKKKISSHGPGEGQSFPALSGRYDHRMCCFCACVHFITPGYTVPVRCHRDPQGFSDTCRWCRCPIPEG